MAREIVGQLSAFLGQSLKIVLDFIDQSRTARSTYSSVPCLAWALVFVAFGKPIYRRGFDLGRLGLHPNDLIIIDGAHLQDLGKLSLEVIFSVYHLDQVTKLFGFRGHILFRI